MSFANQALAVEFIARGPGLAPRAYAVPRRIDAEIARLKLASLGVSCDRLSARRSRYLASWEKGT